MVLQLRPEPLPRHPLRGELRRERQDERRQEDPVGEITISTPPTTLAAPSPAPMPPVGRDLLWRKSTYSNADDQYAEVVGSIRLAGTSEPRLASAAGRVLPGEAAPYRSGGEATAARIVAGE